jgi:sugar-specific transcriptional regulator TrmB
LEAQAKDGVVLSLERVLDALVSLGLTQRDAQVYIYLAKKGPFGEEDLAKTMKLTKQQLHSCLRKLEAKGMVIASLEPLVQFSAVSLERVIDQLLKAKEEQGKALQASRKKLLSSWGSMIENDSANI